MSNRFCGVMLGCLLSAGVARADETRIERSAVPKAALDAVTRKYPKARPLRFAREVTAGVEAFEVELADQQRRIDVSVAADGKVLVEEETIAVSALPEAVRRGLAASALYGKWKVQRAERIIKLENAEAPTFELLVVHGRKRAELVFDRDGKLLEQEIKKPDGN